MRRAYPALLILVLGFLTLRLAVLFSYMDKLYEEEELYRGTVAREIIRGPLIPLWEYLDYQVEYFPGGTLVVGMLAAPLFMLFGQTYISLKLVGLLFALGTFIAWFISLDKFFNRRAAIIASLLFIFCPPFYTKMSLITWGAHPEANFFTALSLLIFYRIFFRAHAGGKSLDFFWLGLCAGFAFWFVQTYLLTLAFIFLCWFALDRGLLLKKTFYIFAGGFLLGFSPGIFYELFYKRGVFGINGSNTFLEFAFCDIGSFLPRTASLLGKDIPNSFLFPWVCGNYLYYFLFLTAFGALFWLNRKSLLIFLRRLLYPVTLKEINLLPESISRESLFLVYPVLFVLIYGLSSYTLDQEHWRDYIGYRYLIPLTPFILVICAIFLERIYRKRFIFYLFLSLILGLGLFGNLSLIPLENFGRYFQDRGYSYGIIGDKIALRVEKGLKDYIAPFNRLPRRLRGEFYEGLGAGIAWRLRQEEAGKIVGFIETQVSAEYWQYCYRGWGTIFAPEYPEDFKKALETAGDINPGLRPFFYEGFGRNMIFFDEADSLKKAQGRISAIDARFYPFCYSGLGYAIGFKFKSFPGRRERLRAMIDKEYADRFRWGMLQGMAAR